MKTRSFSASKPLLLAVTALLLIITVLLAERPFSVASQTASDSPEPTIPAAHPGAFPATPPDVSRITVGAPDLAGYAQMTGAPGAVPSGAAVAIINLNAHNLITATADLQGGFTASLYAPPGASLLVKYETDGTRIPDFWQLAVSAIADATTGNLNQLPGAILYVGGPEVGVGETQAFHTVGTDSSMEPPKRWSAWHMSGELTVPQHPGDWDLTVMPGEAITLTLAMTATSPALNCTGSPTQTLSIHLGLMEMFGDDGVAKPWDIWFDSFLFTPTGLPIEHEGDVPSRQLSGPHFFENLSCPRADVLTGDLELAVALPADLPEGYYRPNFFFTPQVTPSDQVPQAVVWLHTQERASGLPILKVGDAATPRIPWVIFGDELINGQRGATAIQDQGRHVMVNRVTTPMSVAVVPRLDRRSGQPITYHLEPGAAWLTNTDRRLPPPPHIPLQLPSGEMGIDIHLPGGQTESLGPAPVQQSSVRTPTTPGGAEFAVGTGHLGDLFQLYNQDDAFAYAFEQEGLHVIELHGTVHDVFGNPYSLESTFEVMVANVLDLDPNILPTTPFTVNDHFSPGVHLYPPVPAEVHITVTHVPFSDPAQMRVTPINGQANRFGYFHAPAGTSVPMDEPGEFRVDVSAEYHAPGGDVWFGAMTWGGVVESANPQIEAHGRRGMDYKSDTIDDMPIWFRNQDLPPSKIGIENYYPYLSGDIHWGDELPDSGSLGDSIHTILTFEDLTPGEIFYDLIRDHYPDATNPFRWPPEDISLTGLEKRIDIGEAPLFITARDGLHPEAYPEEIELMGYWYGSSQRPDVRVRELISEDNMGTAYWRFDDTYGYQIGEPANGDQPGDIKWEFGGLVMRVISETNPIQEYAVYSSLWVLLPHGCDAYGCARVTSPFQDATGASINGGPIMTLLGEDVDMLFLPKGVRPGDILEVGDTVAFSGHVGPPLDSRVEVTITSPSGVARSRTWHANKIGWLYDPSFDFVADEPGRWTVDVLVEHDRPYIGNGVVPQSHNTGTVLGTSGEYSFYVVEPGSPELGLSSPPPGFLTWPATNIEPVTITAIAPQGTDQVHYTIHDKGIVMGQGALTPGPGGIITLVYDPVALHEDFPMLSLIAHEARRPGLADNVMITFLAEGAEPLAAGVNLIGEEVFLRSGEATIFNRMLLPVVIR